MESALRMPLHINRRQKFPSKSIGDLSKISFMFKLPQRYVIASWCCFDRIDSKINNNADELLSVPFPFGHESQKSDQIYAAGESATRRATLSND